MSRDPKDPSSETVPAVAASRVRTLGPASMELGPLPDLEPIVGGRYRISYLVGRGSFAHVYRATHITIPSIVYAVKVLRRGASEDPSLRERFRLEAEAASSIRSQHIAPVIDFGETQQGLPFLVMPLLVGLPCDRLLQQVGPLRPPDVARFSLDVLDALEVAHDHGVIHRDLKPSNIFIEQAPAGRHPMAKVLDFGIAKLLEESTLAPVMATAVNSFVGTPAFASPEALSGEPDPRGDLYALGHALANMLDGRAPYEGEKTQALAIQRHLSPERVPLGENTLTSGLGEIVAKACEKSTRERFQTASDMAEAIRALGLHLVEIAPLAFIPGGVPEPDPNDDIPTRVGRRDPQFDPNSATVQRASLASTLGPEETPAVPHLLASEAGASLIDALLDTADNMADDPEEDTEPDGVEAVEVGPAQRRRSFRAVLVVMGAVAAFVVFALVLGPGETDGGAASAPEVIAPTGPAEPEPIEEAGASAAAEEAGAEEPAATIPELATVPEVSIEPAQRHAALAVAHASRVELDNLVDLAGTVDGIEAWLGEVRLGQLPLRGAYIPSARPLTFRFVGEHFELTHVVEQTGPVVHRVEPRRRRRHRGGTTTPVEVAETPLESPAETAPEAETPEPSGGEHSLFGPSRTDLRNPFE